VIVFHALPRGEMIFNQASVHARDLIGGDTRAHTATTDGQAAFDFAGSDRSRQRDDEIGIIVGGHQAVRSEVDYFVSRRAEAVGQILLQVEPAVIGCYSYAHVTPSLSAR
jgi:hypothetical protein